MGGSGGKKKRRSRRWRGGVEGGAHGETERMKAEGEPAAGQVSDGEGRQLITPPPPPLPLRSIPLR